MSGGQSQRIAIARALVHGASLLILDEATSALDPATEATVWECMARLRGEKTILAISHQAGLLAVADCTYRMDGRTLRPVETEGVDPAKGTTGKAEVPLSKGG